MLCYSWRVFLDGKRERDAHCWRCIRLQTSRIMDVVVDAPLMCGSCIRRWREERSMEEPQALLLMVTCASWDFKL